MKKGLLIGLLVGGVVVGAVSLAQRAGAEDFPFKPWGFHRGRGLERKAELLSRYLPAILLLLV